MMCMTTRGFMAAAAVTAFLIGAPAAQQPAFEVASVKPNRSGDGGMGIRFPGVGQIRFINMNLREMVRFAFHLMPLQVVGGPEWIDSERYDVIAKAEGRPTMSQVHAMLRTLLAERFALKTHTETRELPIYALVLARADGKLGEKLQPAGPDCRPVSVPNGAPKPPPPPPGGTAIGPGALPPDDVDGSLRCGALFGPGFLTVRDMPMSRFARDLTMLARRMVVDRTGLTGRFDIDVEFTPEFRPQPPPGAPEFPVPAGDGPSLFTALQEQLGLKLESTRGPVDMVVIDHAERPTPD